MSNKEDHGKGHDKEIDQISGVETTGHEWDGLKELNNPLPRWWVWVFVICIIWSAWYFTAYPSWPVPGGATKGSSGYTQHKELAESQAEIMERQNAYLGRFEQASFEEILADEELYAFAMAGGASAFKDNCATCHGTGGEGRKGYPNLNDDDWLWGGSVSTIHQTLLHGIRAGNDETRFSQMPAFGKDGLLKRGEIDAVADYVLSLSGGKQTATYAQGQTLFQTNCASCHGMDGKGGRDFGAPNLADSIWLYGGDRKTVFESVYNARVGVMPAWKDRLNPQTIRQLSVYLHQLGGGEAESASEPASEEVPTNDQQPPTTPAAPLIP